MKYLCRGTFVLVSQFCLGMTTSECYLVVIWVSLRSLHLWRMLEMVAIVFRPLVKGNEALGTRLPSLRLFLPLLFEDFAKQAYP